MKRTILIGVMTSTLILTACSTSGPVNEVDTPGTQDDITIGLVYGIKGDSFYATMVRGAESKAAELGISLTADGPADWDAAIQTPIIDQMISRSVDGLIAVPNDPSAMVAVLERAHDAGIPVVTTDQYIGDGDYVNGPVNFPLSFIASDNFEAGKDACEALIESIDGKGSLYILVSKPNVPTAIARRDGCLEAINATNGAVQSAGVDYADDSSTVATSKTQAALQRDSGIAAIFGGDIFAAEGASTAVKAAGLAGEVKVASFDAPESSINDLRNGVYEVVTAQQPFKIGERAVEYIYAAITGKGEIEPLVEIPAIVITPDSLEEAIAKGYFYDSGN